MNPELSDPVERADQRRQASGHGDVEEKSDGTLSSARTETWIKPLCPKARTILMKGFTCRSMTWSSRTAAPTPAMIIRGACPILPHDAEPAVPRWRVAVDAAPGKGTHRLSATSSWRRLFSSSRVALNSLTRSVNPICLPNAQRLPYAAISSCSTFCAAESRPASGAGLLSISLSVRTAAPPRFCMSERKVTSMQICPWTTTLTWRRLCHWKHLRTGSGPRPTNYGGPMAVWKDVRTSTGEGRGLMSRQKWRRKCGMCSEGYRTPALAEDKKMRRPGDALFPCQGSGRALLKHAPRLLSGNPQPSISAGRASNEQPAVPQKVAVHQGRQ